MKFHSLHILPVALAAVAVMGCDDTVSTIGSSLTGDSVEIVVDSSFVVTGTTSVNDAIRPKTSSQIIGNITIPGYGTLSSNVVTQFLPSTVLDTANFSVENIDSVFLNLTYSRGAYLGDSLAPMGVEIYALDKLLPSDISSDFNPAGYYRTQALASRIYNTSTLDNKTAAQLSYGLIAVKLPLELGKHVFNAFTDNPADFADGRVFAENVFPGVYIRSSFGSGRLTTLSAAGIAFNFRKIVEGEEKNDTIDAIQQYMLATPEVISNNNLTYTMDASLRSRLDAGENILIAPAGTEMEITFPLTAVIDTYRAKAGAQAVLNGLHMSIPVDSITAETPVNVTPPPFLLMVLSKDRDEFFAKNKLPDNKTTFYAAYSSATGEYVFTGMRDYLLEMLDRDEITPDDYTFDLVPVNVTFEAVVNSGYYYSSSRQVVTDVQPYIGYPAVGFVRLSDAKVSLTFSRLTLGN